MTKEESIKMLGEKLTPYFKIKSKIRASELKDFSYVDHVLLFVYSTDKRASWKLEELLSDKLIIEEKIQGSDWTLVRA